MVDEILKQVSLNIGTTYEDKWMYDDTCSYALRFRNTDHIHYQLNDICHARAFPNRYYKQPGPIRSVTTSIWRHKKDSEDFVSWLLDKERSPWRGLFGSLTIHRDDNKIYAVTIDDLDKTDVGSDYVLNFLIASRIHSEKKDEFEMWNKARKHGFNEAESLVIATHLWENKLEDSLYLHVNNRGHFPLNSVNDDDWNRQYKQIVNSVELLEKATPMLNAELWKYKGAIHSVNGCWYDSKRIPIKSFNQLHIGNRAPVYTGAFKNTLGINAAIFENKLKTNLVMLQRGAHDIRLSWDILKKSKHEWRV